MKLFISETDLKSCHRLVHTNMHECFFVSQNHNNLTSLAEFHLFHIHFDLLKAFALSLLHFSPHLTRLEKVDYFAFPFIFFLVWHKGKKIHINKHEQINGLSLKPFNTNNTWMKRVVSHTAKPCLCSI